MFNVSETSNPSGGVITGVGSIPPDAPNTIIIASEVSWNELSGMVAINPSIY